MKKLMAMILASLIVAAGCSSMNQSGGQTSQADGRTIVGSWVGQTPRGGVLDLIFHEDGTVKGSMMEGFPMQFTGTYSVDYSASPMTVDIFGFDDIVTAMSLLQGGGNSRGTNTGADSRYLGIFRFVDDKTIEIGGAFDFMGKRPSDFSGTTMKLML